MNKMLKVNRLTGYAVMLLSTMLKEFEEGHKDLFTANELSKTTNLPLATVVKILKQLTAAKFIKSQRGIKGGYTIPQSSIGINFADLIEALEGPISINDCDLGKECYIYDTCPVRNACSAVNDEIRAALAKVQLKDISKNIDTKKLKS